MAHAALSAFANVNANTADATLTNADGSTLAAIPNKRINVLAAFFMTGATATTLTFNSKGSGAGTAISPLIANGANGGADMSFNPKGWFASKVGETLTVTTGTTGSATGVVVTYEVIGASG